MWRSVAVSLMLALALLPFGIDAQTSTPPAFADRLDLLKSKPDDLGPPMRVARFIHSTDVHILDDDAPYPIRQENLDRLGRPFEGAQRPQEEYTDEAFNAIIPVFNAAHAESPVDFVLFTGDNIDNTLENEVVRFIDNLEGTYTTKGPITGSTYKPDGQSPNPNDASNDVTDAATSLPETFKDAGYNVPLDATVPWYVVFGNHDGLIQGNAPIEPGFREAASRFGRYFVDQQEYIAMHFRNPALHGATNLREFCRTGVDASDPDDGHGFQNAAQRLCDADPDNDAYYTFENGPFLHVVLDTMNDDYVQSNGNFGSAVPPGGTGGYVGGYAEGILDPAQFAWLKRTLAGNTTRPIILHAHHTVNSWVPFAQGSQAHQSGYVTADQLIAEINQHPNIAFYVGGHSHRHRIQPKGTFWNVETASLIDPPHENRIVEIYVAPNATGYLQATRVATKFLKTFELSRTDPQEQGDPDNRDGEAGDRDVRLWFPIPDAVFAPLQRQLDRALVGQVSSEPVTRANHHTPFSFNSTTAFTHLLPPPTTRWNVFVERDGVPVETTMYHGSNGTGSEGDFTIAFPEPGAYDVKVELSGPDVDTTHLSTTTLVEPSDIPSPPRRPPPGTPAIGPLLGVVTALAAARLARQRLRE